MKTISRHKQRIWALQILYSLDLREKLQEDIAEKQCKKFREEKHIEDGEKYYFEKIVFGVIKMREELDKIINEKAIDWEVKRMAYIDRNILRIAIFEIKSKMPVGVAINEAVELAKEYASDKSFSFINGILSKSKEEPNVE